MLAHDFGRSKSTAEYFFVEFFDQCKCPVKVYLPFAFVGELDSTVRFLGALQQLPVHYRFVVYFSLDARRLL